MFGAFPYWFCTVVFVGLLPRWVFALVVIHFVCFDGGRFTICNFLVLPSIEKKFLINHSWFPERSWLLVVLFSMGDFLRWWYFLFLLSLMFLLIGNWWMFFPWVVCLCAFLGEVFYLGWVCSYSFLVLAAFLMWMIPIVSHQVLQYSFLGSFSCFMFWVNC